MKYIRVEKRMKTTYIGSGSGFRAEWCKLKKCGAQGLGFAP